MSASVFWLTYFSILEEYSGNTVFYGLLELWKDRLIHNSGYETIVSKYRDCLFLTLWIVNHLLVWGSIDGIQSFGHRPILLSLSMLRACWHVPLIPVIATVKIMLCICCQCLHSTLPCSLDSSLWMLWRDMYYLPFPESDYLSWYQDPLWESFTCSHYETDCFITLYYLLKIWGSVT